LSPSRVCRDSVARVFRIPTDGSGKSHIYQSRSYSPWPCGSTRRNCGPCPVFEKFGNVNPHCCRTGNLKPPLPERVAGSLRLPLDAPPVARAVTHPDVGAPFQPGAAIAVYVRLAVPPPLPRPDARNVPSRTALALIADSASGGRVGGSLGPRPNKQPLPPRVDPLDHNGSCNGTRTGDEICDPVGGATASTTRRACPVNPVRRTGCPKERKIAARCVSHNEKTFVVYHKMTVFLACGKRGFSKISH